ncbi:MAG: undecaprenyldiphospho-muramoylpentapeptide beta-N-acetylglucosaminyltransferase [Deltaproteobacteria bacterium]|nr:undecaprenyldiphospho-muramoylpentapeptide beta-N-acetylglucosaminyltransferase [Deltaproteobacteria bacterium]
MHKKVLIGGGGTGGHLYAIIALSKFLMEKDVDVLIIGSSFGLEKKIFEKYDFKYYLFPIYGFMGKQIFHKLKSAFSLFYSTIKTVLIIFKFRPQAVIGVGGFVSFPVVFAAFILNKKRAILEQNFVPGKANRLLSHISNRVFLNFPQTKNYFKCKVEVVGNPIRKSISHLKKEEFLYQGILHLLVFGGSLGAHSINEAMMEFAEIYKKNKKREIFVVHQTGKQDYKKVKRYYEKLNLSWKVYDFIEDIGKVYEKSDIVLSRAGASTITEIACIGIPVIFVPYPHAIYNHQYINAKCVEEIGGAVTVKDSKLNGKIIDDIISDIDKDKLLSMSKNIRKLYNNQNIERIYHWI